MSIRSLLADALAGERQPNAGPAHQPHPALNRVQEVIGVRPAANAVG